MSRREPHKSLPLPVERTEPVAAAALESLLRAAVAVGQRNDARAIAAAKCARDQYNTAVNELRRSERLRGREGSVNWVRACMATKRSPDGRPTKETFAADLDRALDELKDATW